MNHRRRIFNKRTFLGAIQHSQTYKIIPNYRKSYPKFDDVRNYPVLLLGRRGPAAGAQPACVQPCLGGGAAGGLSLAGTPPWEADLPWHGVPLWPGEMLSSSSLPGLFSCAGTHAEVGGTREFLGETLKGHRDLKCEGKNWISRLISFFVKP